MGHFYITHLTHPQIVYRFCNFWEEFPQFTNHNWLVFSLRDSVAPVTKFLKVPSGGPPVPARREVGSFDKGQPNLALAADGKIPTHFL